MLDLSALPAERRRFLATVGRRSTVQALMRREERRYPILLALVAQRAPRPHLSARSENVNSFGVITVDVEAELAKLGPAGWRPLRPAAPDLSAVP